MATGTVVFLIIGGLGLGVLALGLLGGEFLHLDHPDSDGPVPLESVAGFAGAFGFGGAIASELLDARAPVLVAVAAGVGVLAAVPTAWLAVRLSRAARNIHTDATPTRDDLIGSIGVVVTPIPPTGYGEVRVRLGGQQVKLNAKSDKAIPLGTRIFVIHAPTDTSVVVEEMPDTAPTVN